MVSDLSISGGGASRIGLGGSASRYRLTVCVCSVERCCFSWVSFMFSEWHVCICVVYLIVL